MPKYFPVIGTTKKRYKKKKKKIKAGGDAWKVTRKPSKKSETTTLYLLNSSVTRQSLHHITEGHHVTGELCGHTALWFQTDLKFGLPATLLPSVEKYHTTWRSLVSNLLLMKQS